MTQATLEHGVEGYKMQAKEFEAGLRKLLRREDSKRKQEMNAMRRDFETYAGIVGGKIVKQGNTLYLIVDKLAVVSVTI